MGDTIEDPPPENIHEYCLQLGLQIRDNESSNNMESSDIIDKQPSEAPAVSLAKNGKKDVFKTNYDCKNCAKCFSSSRQFLKHKCSRKESPESSPKPKRRGRPRKQRRVDGKLAAKEPTPQVDEETGLTETTKDPSHNNDDELKKIDESPSNNVETPSNKVDKSESKNSTVQLQCELCQLFPDSVAAVDNPSGQCEKCQELNKESSQPTSGNTTESDTRAGKKRKYVYRKPAKLCPHCNKAFHSEKRFAKHEKICRKDLKCEICGKDFSGTGGHEYNKYENHYYMHKPEEKPHHCAICNKGFIRKPNLDKHSIIHTTENVPQTCQQCGAVFATTKLLNKHKKRHDRPTWDCERCKKQFVRQVVYDKHMITCQVEVSCEVCGKIFTCLSKNVKYRYQEHMFIHTGEKPYKCQYCENAFRDRSTRKKHERTHTGEKPYPCTLCDRSFAQLRILRNHVLTHTGEKPYPCQLCDLRFAKQCNLKYHIRVHTKEKPYSCQLCHKSFTQSGTYHKHMRRHQSRGEGVTTNGVKTMETEPDQVTMPIEPPPVAIIPTENLDGEQIVQEIPIATDEITIIVSEGNVDGTSLATIDVEQISNIIFAACS